MSQRQCIVQNVNSNICYLEALAALFHSFVVVNDILVVGSIASTENLASFLSRLFLLLSQKNAPAQGLCQKCKHQY